MKKLICLMIVCSCLTLSAAAQQPTGADDFQQLVQQGLAALESGKGEEAVRIF